MSADKYSVFYCLTESGWQPIENEDTPVEGWVGTCEVVICQGSPFGRTSSHRRRLKVNPKSTAEDAMRLKQQFAMPDPLYISPDELKRLLDRALNSERVLEVSRLKP